MAHYAFINDSNTVVEVITGIDEDQLIEGLTPEEWYGDFRGMTCIRTSYNAATNGFRYNFAGIGDTYDAELDAFIRPKCHEEATLNEEVCQWNCTNGDHLVIS
jgi:hypothetical protein